jgi:hypothetical protein
MWLMIIISPVMAENDQKDVLLSIFDRLIRDSSQLGHGLSPVSFDGDEISPHLSNQLKCKIELAKRSYDEMQTLSLLAEKSGVDLPMAHVISNTNVPMDLIFFRSSVQKGSVTFQQIAISQNEAEILAIREELGDNDNKVFVGSSVSLAMYFAVEEGLWKLREVVYKDPDNLNYLHTLTRLLEVREVENRKVVDRWRQVLKLSTR